MKQEKYIKYMNNLNRNRNVYLDSVLPKIIKSCYRINDTDLLINDNNLNKINKRYIKNKNIKTIVIDCDLINIFKKEPIKSIEKNINKKSIETLNKIRLKNIYLKEGNKVTQKLFNKIKIILKYKDININNTVFKIKNYDNRINYHLNELANLIIAYKMNNKREQYTFIYEKVSEELDKRFRNHNVCGFKDNLCKNKVCLKDKYDLERLITGCCYTQGRVCPNLDKDHCKINCLACKFFTCYKLRFEGIFYHPSDFLLIKNFFNHHQLVLLRDTLFVDKDDMVSILLKEKKVPKKQIKY